MTCITCDVLTCYVRLVTCCGATSLRRTRRRSRGHAVAILRQHRADIADEALSVDEHARLLGVIQRVARMMKRQLPCERVYVATLCDVVQHLHYHLIPRYATDVKGFGFLGQREAGYRTGYRVGPAKLDDRVEYIESLARALRRGLD